MGLLAGMRGIRVWQLQGLCVRRALYKTSCLPLLLIRVTGVLPKPGSVEGPCKAPV